MNNQGNQPDFPTKLKQTLPEILTKAAHKANEEQARLYAEATQSWADRFDREFVNLMELSVTPAGNKHKDQKEKVKAFLRQEIDTARSEGAKTALDKFTDLGGTAFSKGLGSGDRDGNVHVDDVYTIWSRLVEDALSNQVTK